MFDRRLVAYFDWGLLVLVMSIAVFGVITLYSAVAGNSSSLKILYIKQMIWYGIGLLVMVGSFVFNYKLLDRWAHVIYGASIVLLLSVIIMGKYGGGSKRWLMLGPISIQPSEIAKIAVVIVLSRYYAKFATSKGLTLKELFVPLIYTMIPFGLIVIQPDLGTAMLLVLIVGTITIFVKIEKRSLIYLIFCGAAGTGALWFFLKDYQRQRIMTFIDPDRDPLGAGYHIIQSKIAIGSGMVYGKGFMKGTQNALSFLPEQHTDFIFSVLAEQWGFLGAGILLLLLLILIIWGLSVAHGSRDPFGAILSVGITGMLFWQCFINVGMVMGLMPVVGVPLPFVSYGGSSIITVMVGIGILLNVSMRRYLFES